MRYFSSALKQHLAQETTTVCTCWIVKRADGQTLGFTDHDRALAIEDVLCEAATGFLPTEAVSRLGLSVDEQEVQGALSAEAIGEQDLKAGKYDGARVEIWMVNWSDPSQRHHMRTAVLGEVSIQEDLFSAELRGLTAVLDQNYGRTFSRSCDAVLGDARCAADVSGSNFSASGAVYEVSSSTDLRCTGLSGFAHDWFARGRLTWTSGANAGTSVELTSAPGTSGDMVVLWRAMPITPEVGDQFSITAGCDKRFATCRDKFSNQLNFQGFPHMPGSDFTLGVAGNDAVHDGTILIK